jgi:hypothetical protein
MRMQEIGWNRKRLGKRERERERERRTNQVSRSEIVRR